MVFLADDRIERRDLLDDFTQRGPSELGKEWYDASAINTLNMWLTHEQLASLADELQDVAERYAAKYKRVGDEGSRRVQIQLNAFPILGASSTLDVSGSA